MPSRISYNLPPPRSTLLEVITDEWIRHVFIGALPWAAAMWAWDQCFIQGWQVTVQLSVCCAWLMRRELRCLAAEGANVDDLREVVVDILPEMHPRYIRDAAEAMHVGSYEMSRWPSTPTMLRRRFARASATRRSRSSKLSSQASSDAPRSCPSPRCACACRCLARPRLAAPRPRCDRVQQARYGTVVT